MASGSAHGWDTGAGIKSELYFVGKVFKVRIVRSRFQEQNGPLGIF
jgi:hypothetical protein